MKSARYVGTIQPWHTGRRWISFDDEIVDTEFMGGVTPRDVGKRIIAVKINDKQPHTYQAESDTQMERRMKREDTQSG